MSTWSMPVSPWSCDWWVMGIDHPPEVNSGGPAGVGLCNTLCGGHNQGRAATVPRGGATSRRILGGRGRAIGEESELVQVPEDLLRRGLDALADRVDDDLGMFRRL